MIDDSFEVPTAYCPTCGYRMDHCTNVHGGNLAPDPGDYSVCLNCGELLVFEVDMSLRAITAAELPELIRDSEAWQAVEHAQQLIRHRGPITKDSQ